MKFKTRLSESVMVGVRIGVVSKKLGEPVQGGGAVCTLDFVLDDGYTGAHTCESHQGVHLRLSCFINESQQTQREGRSGGQCRAVVGGTLRPEGLGMAVRARQRPLV